MVLRMGGEDNIGVREGGMQTFVIIFYLPFFKEERGPYILWSFLILTFFK